MSDKKRIYIWGSGNGLGSVLKSLDFDLIRIEGLIDNNIEKVGMRVSGFEVILPNRIDKSVDYIIIAALYSYQRIKTQLIAYGYNEKRIISYYDKYDIIDNQQINFLNTTLRTCELIEIELKYSLNKINNLEYEIADRIKNDEYKFPIIKNATECLQDLIKNSSSLCRFGDGEFEMIMGRERPEFQSPNKVLSKRLREILTCSSSKPLIGIADNYGDLTKYTKIAQNGIRTYMTSNVRKEHLEVLDLNKVYYDAYVSRPYIIYQDKEYAKRIFDLWKKLWNQRDIVIVEGELLRCGYKNDLFDNVNSIGRILCESRNAWNQYDKIFSFVIENISKDKLILIALGPTATVLAYDLSELGYQAIDMGQLDNEYEWYLRNAEEQVNITYKYVSEYGVLGQIVDDIDDKEFKNQIIAKIKDS